MYNKFKCGLMGLNTSSPIHIEKSNIDMDKVTESFISEHCEICQSKFMDFETFIHAFLRYTNTPLTEYIPKIEILRSLKKHGMENNGTDIYITGQLTSIDGYIYITEHLKSTIVVGIMLVSWPRKVLNEREMK
jgi:hypothetical protein